MKKQFLQLALCSFILLFLASTTRAYTGTTSTPPSNNTDAPIDVSSSNQVKTGGLVVNAFTASGGSYFDKQVFFNGPVAGSVGPGNSTIQFGDLIDKTSLAITDGLATLASLRADSLMNSTNNTPVCADKNGVLILCSATQVTPSTVAAAHCSNVDWDSMSPFLQSQITQNSDGTCSYAPPKIVAATGQSSTQVDNLSGGHYEPGVTTFSLGTGDASVNQIAGYNSTDFIIKDSWPNYLSNGTYVNTYQSGDLSVLTDPNTDLAGIRSDADITPWSNALVLTVPVTGTYDFNYTADGQLSMYLTNNSQPVGNFYSRADFYLSVKKASGGQDNYPLVPISTSCNPNPVNNMVIANYQPCSGAGYSNGGKTYHQEEDYAINFSKTINLQKGDKVYLFGLSFGVVFAKSGTLSLGDGSIPFRLTVNSNQSNLNVTLH